MQTNVKFTVSHMSATTYDEKEINAQHSECFCQKLLSDQCYENCVIGLWNSIQCITASETRDMVSLPQVWLP